MDVESSVSLAPFCHLVVHAQGHSQDAHDSRGMPACLPPIHGYTGLQRILLPVVCMLNLLI
jgi:hypothetical protein